MGYGAKLRTSLLFGNQIDTKHYINHSYKHLHLIQTITVRYNHKAHIYAFAVLPDSNYWYYLAYFQARHTFFTKMRCQQSH